MYLTIKNIKICEHLRFWRHLRAKKIIGKWPVFSLRAKFGSFSSPVKEETVHFPLFELFANTNFRRFLDEKLKVDSLWFQ